MEAERYVGASIRVSPRIMNKLEAGPAHQRRSLTNTIEVLVEDYCSKNNLDKSQKWANP